MTKHERHPFALLTALWLGLPIALLAQTATLTPSFSPTLQMTPPCAAGAVTFGKTTLGATGDAQYDSSIRASKYSLSIPATVYTISLYNSVVVTGTQAQVGIYQDNSGAIGPLLTHSLPVSVANGWNVIPIPPVPLAAGDYWLAYLYDSPGAYKITYDQTAGVDSAALTSSSVTLGNFPSLFPAPQYSSNWHEAIHASVCGPDTPTPTETNTRTPTRTPTDTRTQTSTRTPTSTGTVLTPTRTATSTPTSSATSTRTHTPDPSLTPVCGTGAGQFGKTNVGDCLGYQAGAAVALRASLYPLSESATIVSLSLYQHPGNEGTSIRVGLYQYLGGNVGNLIVDSGEKEAGAGWNHFLIPETPLPAGNYWLAYLYSASSPYTVLAASAPSGLKTLAFSTSVLWGSLPPIIPSAGYGDDWHEPIYANYCPGPVDTATPSPTRTESFTPTPSPSLSATPSPTDPYTPTQTPTGTLPTSTHTATGTPTSTGTHTFTPTESPSPSPTRTITPTPVLTPPCSVIGTFGRTSLGSFSSGFTGSAAGVRGSQYPLSQGATVYSLSTYQLNGGFPLAAAIYTDQLGSVKDFIVGSSPQVLVAGWNLLPIPATYLPPGNYWLVFHYNMGVGGSYEAVFGTSPSGSNTAFTYSGPVVVGAFPGQFGGITYEDNDREIIYASFCPLATSTPTSTPTLGETPTATPTMSQGLTSTSTLTPTPSSSPTGTPSSTATSTASGTSTPTLAMTGTASSTGTSTATGQPTSTSSGTSTATPSRTPTPLNSPTSTASPTASETGTSTWTPAASASFTSTDTPTATLTSSHTAASTSTSTRTSTPTSSTTLTPTQTFSASDTPTSTISPTSTASTTMTPVPFTPTPSASPTRTPSATNSATAAVQAGTAPVILQNPARSGTILLLPPIYPGTSQVLVELFTTAFRRVTAKNYPPLPSGNWLVVELLDDQGRALANGVYYLRLSTDRGRSLCTLVIAR